MPNKDNKQASLDRMVKEAAAKKYGLGTIVADSEKVSGAAEKINTLASDVERMKPIVEKVALIQDSIKGEDGKDGADGRDGVDGVDGNHGNDGIDGVDGVNGVDGKDGRDGVDGKDGVDGRDGADAEPLKVIEAIKALKGKDAAAFSQVVGSKIDISHVRNAGSFIFNGKTYKTEELMHGGGSSSGAGVTTVSVVTAHGLAGTVANATTTPAITLSTTVTGIVKGDGTSFSAAAAGTDYQIPISLTTTGTSGAATFNTGTGALNIPQYSGGGTPGGLNTQIQYNNSGVFGGITGAVTDGTAVSLNAPHLLNPTINGAGAGLATLVYPNTATNATITVPATTGTLALTSQLTTGTVTTVSIVTANGFAGTVANATTTPAITLTTSITGVLKGNGTAISAGVAGDVDSILPTQTGNSGKVLSTNGTNSSWISAGGTGTVTSVASADGSITVTNPNTTVDLAVVKAPIWTTARNLAGNSVNGSSNVAFANKFVVQGTSDAGLSGAQFLGALGTGIVKNTTTTGVLSIAVAADFPTLNQNTTGSAATLTTPRAINGVNFDGSAAITVTAAAGTLTGTTLNSTVVTSSLTSVGTLASLSVTGNITNAALTASKVVFTDASKNLTSTGIGTSAQFIKGDGSLDSSTYITGNQTITLSGDVTGSGTTAITTALATVNSNVGSFTNANVTVNAKGLITAASNGTAGLTTLTVGTTTITSGTSTRMLYDNGGVLGETTGITTNGTVATLTTPVLTGLPTGTGVAATPTVSTLAARDANGNLSAINFIDSSFITTTAGGTTTLTVGSANIQIFSGTTTQTVTMPVASTLVVGQQWYFLNLSTGAVTINSSGANAIVILAGLTAALITCTTASGTTNTSWTTDYKGVSAASGKKAVVNNSLTLNGTDATTMTFPTTSATIARTDAAQTFTGVQTFSSAPVLSTSTITVGAGTNTLQAVTDTVVYRATTDTLSNKNIQRRLVTVSAPGATPTTTLSTTDIANFTGIAANITNMSTNLNPLGGVDGQLLEYRFVDNGTAKTIAWGTSFTASTVALPTTTVASTVLRVLFEYNGTTFVCIAVA